MPVTRPPIERPEQLRAVAHQARLDLLDLLARGPLTAADAARELGQTPSNVSWHLHQLARHGLVRQLPDQGGRRRPWKIVAHARSSDPGVDTGLPSAQAAAYDDVALEQDIRSVRATLAERVVTGDHVSGGRLERLRVWLSPDEAAALSAALEDAVRPYRDRTGRVGEAAALTSVVVWMAPVPPTGR